MPAAVQDDTTLVQVQTRSDSSRPEGTMFKGQQQTQQGQGQGQGQQQQMHGAYDAASPASRPLFVSLAVDPSKAGSLPRPIVISMHPEVIRLTAYAMFWLMVLLAVFITKVFVDEDLDNSPLVNMFGYNNICIMWDYEPATSVIAMFYPAVEVPLVLYLVLNFLRVRESFRAGLIGRARFGVCCALFPAELTFVLWFRMIFVVKAFEDVQGHTLGFHGLMLALCMVALQNFLYHDSIGRLVGPRWLSISYLVALYAVTLAKFVIAWSIFAGRPLWTTANEDGNRLAQGLDSLWMILASVMPAWFAWKNRLVTPAMEITLGIESAAPASSASVSASATASPPAKGQVVPVRLEQF